ncbi:MAG: ABC transporter ATP-binding protein [Oceanicaulis sp.]
MGYALETRDLCRSFGEVTAVDQVSLAVPERSVFGFLGPNGAGKTTTIRMLLGLIRPDHGAILIGGIDVRARRSRALRGVGAIVESPALYPNLTGRETVRMAARLLGATAREAEVQLERVGLGDAADRLVGGYSLGMRQRLALARAMIGEPGLLILDEPTNGLDPAGIAEMRELIRALPDLIGATVFLSSHMLGEIEQTATHCALIDRGRLVFQNRLEVLADTAPHTLAIETDRPAALTERFLNQSIHAHRDGNVVRARLELDREGRAALTRALTAEGYGVSGLWTERASLERLFLTLTGRGRETA